VLVCIGSSNVVWTVGDVLGCIQECNGPCTKGGADSGEVRA